MVGVMHEWVQRPEAYDLAQAAPAMIDCMLAGLVARPPLRAPREAVRARPAMRGTGGRRDEAGRPPHQRRG